MGLRKVFTASDLVAWRPYAPLAPTGFGGLLPAPYHAGLVTAPRIYGEEPNSRFASGSHLAQGALWAQREGVRSTINVLLMMRQSAWPSWNASVWKFDGATGAALARQPKTASGSDTGASASYDLFTSEPTNGALWWYGAHASAYHAGVVEVDPATTAQKGTVIPYSAFEMAPELAQQDAAEAFAIDREQRRAYVRWLGASVRRVDAYDLQGDGTWMWAHTLYAGSAVDQVLMTDTGTVYLIDENDWLTVYTAAGSFSGAVRNPRTAVWPFGYLYGWDRFYRRVLFLAGTENAADGASTLRVEAFYPSPAATRLSPPVPIERPRSGRRLALVASLSGDGGEPIAAMPGKLELDGVLVAAAVSDGAGDLLFRCDLAPGERTVTVTVDGGGTT